jgi:hypothetical protein
LRLMTISIFVTCCTGRSAGRRLIISPLVETRSGSLNSWS